MITYSVTFSSADQADRAAARLRSRGVPVQQYLVQRDQPAREPGLLVGYPYSYPASTRSPDYTTGLINGLPQTDGNAVIMPMPFFRTHPTAQVAARITVADHDAVRARRMLVNSGGQEVHIVH